MINFSRRVPSFFCCSRSSSTCLVVRSPSSTNASAMRSPRVFTGGIGSTKNFAQPAHEFVRRRQIPEESAAGKTLEFQGGLLIKGVCRRDQDGFAHPIKRQETPAMT